MCRPLLRTTLERFQCLLHLLPVWSAESPTECTTFERCRHTGEMCCMPYWLSFDESKNECSVEHISGSECVYDLHLQ